MGKGVFLHLTKGFENIILGALLDNVPALKHLGDFKRECEASVGIKERREREGAKRPDSLSKKCDLGPPNAPCDVHTIVGIVTIRRRRCFMVSSLKCRFSKFR